MEEPAIVVTSSDDPQTQNLLPSPSPTPSHSHSASLSPVHLERGGGGGGRTSLREQGPLDVISEEQEVLITQLPLDAYPEPPVLPQPPEFTTLSPLRHPEHETGPEIDETEQQPGSQSTANQSTPVTERRRRTGANAVPPASHHVSSDDEDYETDLEYDEEVWLNPDKPNEHDTTGRAKYIKVCSDLGVTPVTSYLASLRQREINLKYYGLGLSSTKAISVPLETNTITEKLNLEGNGIDKDAAKFLCRVLKENLYISELILRDNVIGREGAAAMCDLMVHNTCITKLDLSGNQIEDTCAPLMANVLARNGVLKQLYLSHNRLSDSGAQHLQGAISDNVSLELLDLGWNHFGPVGAALLAHAVQDNVGLKHFYMPMAGVGNSGCCLIEEVLRSNRTLLEFDVSFCRIPGCGIIHIASGLRENDILQVFRIGSNPFDADCAMALLQAVEENDSSCIKHLDLTDIFVKREFVDLANKLEEQRELSVQVKGVLPEPVKFSHTVAEMVAFRTDPIGALRTCLETKGAASPAEVFHQNGPDKITKQEFTDTIRMAQLDLTQKQINILFSKVNTNGMVSIEHLLDLLEHPVEEPPAED